MELRKEWEKFLKSLREMSYYEWRIDKTLTEAGGLGKTVYILPARGQRSPVGFIMKSLEEGRHIEFVTLKKYEMPRFSDKDISVIRNSIQQMELYSKLVNPWRDPMYQKLLKGYDYF